MKIKKLKDLLKESNVWDRKFGESLPTLKQCEERYKQKLSEARKYKLGDMWSNDFDYEGMLKLGMKADLKMGGKKLRKLFDSFEDVNYHTVSKPLWAALESLRTGDEAKAKSLLKKFNQLCKKEL